MINTMRLSNIKIGPDLENFLWPANIISILLMLGGAGSLYFVLPVLVGNVFLGILQLIISVGLITTSFGLLKMKKWGIHAYTIITILAVSGHIYYFLASHSADDVQLVAATIEILVLIYFWKIF